MWCENEMENASDFCAKVNLRTFVALSVLSSTKSPSSSSSLPSIQTRRRWKWLRCAWLNYERDDIHSTIRFYSEAQSENQQRQRRKRWESENPVLLIHDNGDACAWDHALCMKLLINASFSPCLNYLQLRQIIKLLFYDKKKRSFKNLFTANFIKFISHSSHRRTLVPIAQPTRRSGRERKRKSEWNTLKRWENWWSDEQTNNKHYRLNSERVKEIFNKRCTRLEQNWGVFHWKILRCRRHKNDRSKKVKRNRNLKSFSHLALPCTTQFSIQFLNT